MQAGGRRFDPVWLHQTVDRRAVGPPELARLNEPVRRQELVREKPYSSVRGFAAALVLSDIVKRRSIRPGIAIR